MHEHEVDAPRCTGKTRKLRKFSDTPYSRSVGKFAKRLRLQCLAVMFVWSMHNIIFVWLELPAFLRPSLFRQIPHSSSPKFFPPSFSPPPLATLFCLLHLALPALALHVPYLKLKSRSFIFISGTSTSTTYFHYHYSGLSQQQLDRPRSGISPILCSPPSRHHDQIRCQHLPAVGGIGIVVIDGAPHRLTHTLRRRIVILYDLNDHNVHRHSSHHLL